MGCTLCEDLDALSGTWVALVIWRLYGPRYGQRCTIATIDFIVASLSHALLLTCHTSTGTLPKGTMLFLPPRSRV